MLRQQSRKIRNNPKHLKLPTSTLNGETGLVTPGGLQFRWSRSSFSLQIPERCSKLQIRKVRNNTKHHNRYYLKTYIQGVPNNIGIQWQSEDGQVYSVCILQFSCFTKYNRMQSKHKQTKCEHSRRNFYRLQLSQ